MTNVKLSLNFKKLKLGLEVIIFLSVFLRYEMALGQSKCEDLLKTPEQQQSPIVVATTLRWGNNIYPVQEVKNASTLAYRADLIFKENSQDQNHVSSLYLGFSEEGHTYIVYGKYRISGSILQYYRKLRFKHPGFLKGFVIKLPNLKADSVQLFGDDEYSYLSCVSCAQDLLKHEFEFKLHKSQNRFLTPAQFLKKLMDNGITLPNGQKIYLTLYYVGESSPQEALNSIIEVSHSYGMLYKVMAPGAVFSVLGILGFNLSQLF